MTKTRSGKDSALSEDFSDLSEDGKKIVAAISAKIDVLESNFNKMLEEKEKRICELEDQVSTLKKNLSKIEERLDDSEAFERRNSLIFSGTDVPNSTASEKCSDIVCNLIKDKLKIEIPASAISSSSRLGKKPLVQGPDRRGILVNFCRSDIKKDILAARKAVKPDNIYINEHLTPIRNTIMYLLRKAKHQFRDKISGCSSLGGRVFVWVRPPNPDAPGPQQNSRMQVNTHHQLDKFCTDILHTPLSTFIDTWPY